MYLNEIQLKFNAMYTAKIHGITILYIIYTHGLHNV